MVGILHHRASTDYSCWQPPFISIQWPLWCSSGISAGTSSICPIYIPCSQTCQGTWPLCSSLRRWHPTACSLATIHILKAINFRHHMPIKSPQTNHLSPESILDTTLSSIARNSSFSTLGLPACTDIKLSTNLPTISFTTNNLTSGLNLQHFLNPSI